VERTALPVPPTPFVGRAADLDMAVGLAARPDVRVVTLTGPAGVGKTRLGIEVARRLAASFPDGTLFVALADVHDAVAVLPAVMRCAGTADVGSRPAFDVLVEVLGTQEILLVLDNVEHVIDAASSIARLVEACSGMTVLATSRRPLGIRAEHCLRVPPLAVPESPGISAGEALRNDAVALLVSRLQAIDARYQLADADVPALAGICSRVDGLPLALELAAARARELPLAAIRDALETRLPLLTGGERDQPARQRTMADAIAWSYDLLDAPAAALFRRLGVCAGGCMLDAAQALAGDCELSDVEVVDALGGLVAHSLVHRDGDGTRYRMLEVVREFAAAQLERMGEDIAARRRHARHFLDVAESASARQIGPEQADALDRLQADAPNLAAAVRWAVDDGDAETALRLCRSLRFLWYVRGSIAEGRSLFAAALAVPGAATGRRARALVEASALARHHGDFAAARALAGEGLAMARAGDDPDLLAAALLQHGFVLHLLRDYGAARAALEECLAIRHAMDDALGVARASHHLGLVAYFGDGDVSLAWEMQCRCLALFRELGNQRHVATALISMAELARARGELRRAQDLLADGVAEVTRLDDAPLLVYALHHAASIAADAQHPSRAVRLLGAAEGLEVTTGAAPWPAVAAGAERWLPGVERSLGTHRVAALRTAGRRTTAAEAVALVVAHDDGPADPLTRREYEIAGLVAVGLTNRAIAARLVVSERTVDGHVARILAKLDASSRAQIAAWVVANDG